MKFARPTARGVLDPESHPVFVSLFFRRANDAKLVIQSKTPKGGDRRPTFIPGDFVEVFIGERSPFEEVAM